MKNKLKLGDKVKIIGQSRCELSITKLKGFFPDLIGYVNYISDKIVAGKTYVIIHPKQQERGAAFGWGFLSNNLKKI